MSIKKTLGHPIDQYEFDEPQDPNKLGGNKNEKNFLKDLFSHHVGDNEKADFTDINNPPKFRSAGTIKVGKFDQKYKDLGQNSSRMSITD